jgi:hypothetical protein
VLSTAPSGCSRSGRSGQVVHSDIVIWPFKTQESLHPNYWAQLAYQSCLTQAYGDGTAVIGGTACTAAQGWTRTAGREWI